MLEYRGLLAAAPIPTPKQQQQMMGMRTIANTHTKNAMIAPTTIPTNPLTVPSVMGINYGHLVKSNEMHDNVLSAKRQ